MLFFPETVLNNLVMFILKRFLAAPEDSDMPIYRNIVVAIPPEGYIGKKDQSVFVKDRNEYDPAVKYNRVSHVIIGKAIDKTRMHPNHNFRMRYPEAFQEAAGEPQLKSVKRMGMYAVVLALLEKNSLYRCLYEAMGITSANLILDFCMYAILHHSAASDRFRYAMSEQMLFSCDLKSGRDLSLFFDQDENIAGLERFKSAWAGVCKKRGVRDVWLVIDRLDNDGAGDAAQEQERAQSPKGVREKEVPAVNYLYAVDVSDGTPVSCAVFRGNRGNNRIHGNAVMKMMGWLKAYEMNVTGVVVNQDFAARDFLEMLDSNELPYVALLREDASAHKAMLAEYAAKIGRQFKYMLDRYDNNGNTDRVSILGSNDHVCYGITAEDKVKLFPRHNYKACVSLIFDGRNGEERQESWFKKISDAAAELQRELNSENAAEVPGEFKEYLEIRQKDGKKTVLINMEKAQLRGDEQGFSTLASSAKMSAGKAHEIYTMGQSAGTDFAIVKAQLGSGITTGELSETEIITRISIGFIASIIRNELMKTAKRTGLPAHGIARELNGITMGLNQNDRYFVSHTESEKQKKFLKECGVVPADLDRLAEAENKRISSENPDPVRKFPQADAAMRNKSSSGEGTAASDK